MYYEKLLDCLLDKISLYGMDYITDTEKSFLENYTDYDRMVELYKDISETREYYYQMFQYDPRDDNESFMEVGMNFSDWTEKEILEGKYGVMWDNMDVEYFDVYMRIYKVPNKYIDMRWFHLPERVKKAFIKFLKDEFDIT